MGADTYLKHSWCNPSLLCSTCVLAQTVLALCIKVLKKLYFAERLLWLSQLRYWPVLVRFLYTRLIMCCQVLAKPRCPRKGLIYHCWKSQSRGYQSEWESKPIPNIDILTPSLFLNTIIQVLFIQFCTKYMFT